jgi:hypothetical protein
VGDGVALVLSEPSHTGLFGDVLTDESIGVLVASVFPRVMQGGEVEGDAGGLFDPVVGMNAVPLSAVTVLNRSAFRAMSATVRRLSSAWVRARSLPIST